MDIQNLLKIALYEQDGQRARSQQTTLGASSVGGCRRQAWNILNEVPKTNYDTEHLAAIIGTAIHSTIAGAMEAADPFGEDFLIEQGFETDLLKGHCDLFIKSTGTVIDWKTTTKGKLAKFPDDQQRMQVQLYGYLIEEAGHMVNEVALVAIPRDGQTKDIKVHSEPYSREMAQQGLDWIEEVKSMDKPPAPEKSAFFCRNYCSWFDPTGSVGCPGK